MMIKRLLLVVISLALGAIITAGLVILLLETTIAEYGAFYFGMTAFFIACAIGIWLDKFMGTEFLPE